MAAEHPVPDAALDADIATVAQKGAGKTYLNRGLVERLLDAGRRVVVLDPLNSWWGLKARADGRPGYPIAVVGGPNADVALDPQAGERLGEFVARSEISVVLDVSELKRGELIRFANDFLGALYRVNRQALWLVLEEADVFAPQQPMGDATFLLHQVDQIARRGRARGFRLWSITQRPAKLHKDVLSMASSLIMLRIRGPQDRAAALDWIKGNADRAEAREIVDTLAALPVGEGWVYAPDHDLLERVKFPPIRTLDTSATPQAGAPRPAVGKLAQADVAALRQALAPPATTTAEDAPPKQRAGSTAMPGDEAIARFKTAAYAEGHRDGLATGRRIGASEAARRAAELTKLWAESLPDSVMAEMPELPPPATVMLPSPAANTGRAVVKSAAEPRAATSGGPSKGAQALLEALRGAPRERLFWNDVAILAVLSPTAGYTRAAINELRAHRLVTEASDGVALANLAEGVGVWHDPVEIVDAWATKIGGAGARILRHLWEVGAPLGAAFLSAGDVARAIDLSPTAGYTRAGWKKLRSNNLIREHAADRWDVASVLRELQKARTP